MGQREERHHRREDARAPAENQPRPKLPRGFGRIKGDQAGAQNHGTRVQDRTRAINFLHALTNKYDVDLRKGEAHVWGGKVLRHLEGVRLGNRSDQLVLEGRISKIRYYNGEIKRVDGAILSYVKGNHAARLLLSITGTDAFSAALVTAEIDGIGRFGSPKKLVSWASMCPTLHQSGDAEYHGRMKKDSNRKVNWVMVQCALSAAMYDPRMKAYYERLKEPQAKRGNHSRGQQDAQDHLAHADR